MSATADISRYRDYFRDLGRGERVEVLAIPSSNQKTVFQRRVSYLEQACIYTLLDFLSFLFHPTFIPVFYILSKLHILNGFKFMLHL